jgi:phosphatidate cytidylyltransferase
VLADRARSAAFLIPPVLVALLLGRPAIAVVVVVAVALAGVETFRLLEQAGHPSFALLGTVAGVALALGDSLTQLPGGGGLLMAAVAIVLIGVAALTRPDPRDGLAAFATTTFGAMYIGLFGFVARLSAAGIAPDAGAPLGWLGPERAWVILLVLGVWSFDTGAYATGRRFGRRPFMQHISPSKTQEGVAGGIAAATVVCAAITTLLGTGPLMGLVLGPVLSAAAQAGDLAESMLKRAAGAKDSGRLIPGHGGVLDRIDSFLFAAPVVFLYVAIVLG